MYEKCLDNDKKKYWSLITENQYIYYYCLHIKDRPELWKKLSDGFWLFEYCKCIKNRIVLSRKILEEIDDKGVNTLCG